MKTSQATMRKVFIKWGQRAKKSIPSKIKSVSIRGLKKWNKLALQWIPLAAIWTQMASF